MAIVTESEVRAFLGRGSKLTDAELGLAMALIRPGIEAKTSKILGFRPDQRTYVEFYPESDQKYQTDDAEGVWDIRNGRASIIQPTSDVIELRNRPVRSITHVYQDYGALGGQAPGSFGAGSELTQGVDFYLDNIQNGVSWTGQIRKWMGTWPWRARSVKVEYVAGFTDAELSQDYSDIKMAVLMGIQFTFAALKQKQLVIANEAGFLKSESLGDWSASYNVPSSAAIDDMTMSLPAAAVKLLEPYMRVDFL